MLNGPPVRFSLATDFSTATKHEGFIKLRLGHSDRGSVLVPDQIFLNTGSWQFFQPSFFGPNIIGFNVENDLHLADFNVDVGPPRVKLPTRLLVHIRSDERIKSYPDGSELYSCQVKGPKRLASLATGKCRRMNDGDFALKLFHHTNATAHRSICRSQELWTSPWNLQGIRKLSNVAYVYLTSLRTIKTPDDLQRIAMVSSGKILFQTTSNRLIEEKLEMTVRRENTTGCAKTVAVEVPAALLAPPHLFFHPFHEGAYYETVGPEIFRIGLVPGAKLPIPLGLASPSSQDLKRFQYIVLGDTSCVEGLAALMTKRKRHRLCILSTLIRKWTYSNSG
jgi:hypothetical protein